MIDDHVDWDTLVQKLAGGDDEAYVELWSRYGGRLTRIAGRHLPKHFQRRVQPEDVVQSVCRTFFRRMSEGKLEIGEAQQLWPLLCAITLNKVRMQIRYQLRGKRDLGREMRLAEKDSTENADVQPREFEAEDVDPQEAVAFAEQLEWILAELTDQERQVVQLRLDGHDTKDIAQQLQVTTRTVRRVSSRIRERLMRELLDDVRRPLEEN